MSSFATLKVDGRTVRYLTGGNPAASRTLLLLHAFPVGVSIWDPQIDAFPSWRVLAPALPGFDGSDPIPDTTIDGYAAHLVRFVEAMGLQRACVAGLSLGGYLLLAWLRRAPALISGVILADTRSGADGPEARESRQRMLATLAAEGVPAIANDVIPKLLGPSTRRDRPAVAARVRDRIESQPADAIAAAVRVMLSRPDATPVLETIRVPALVIVGEEDALTPPAEAEHLHAAIAGSTLTRIPHAGHLTSLENPEAFNAAVAQLLIQLP